MEWGLGIGGEREMEEQGIAEERERVEREREREIKRRNIKRRRRRELSRKSTIGNNRLCKHITNSTLIMHLEYIVVFLCSDSTGPPDDLLSVYAAESPQEYLGIHTGPHAAN